MAHRALKQWCLTKHETVNSFENWRQNVMYTLSLDSEFSPFLLADRLRLVKERYGTELRSRTLASINPEISQTLDSLLIELQASEVADGHFLSKCTFLPY